MASKHFQKQKQAKQEKRLSTFFSPQKTQDSNDDPSLDSSIAMTPSSAESAAVTTEIIKTLLDNTLKEIQEKSTDPQNAISRVLTRIQTIEEKQEHIEFQIQTLKDTHKETEMKVNQLETKIADLEDRARRTNLKFRNIPENITNDKLKDFMK
ncbi:Hypothetical predicted protein [Pelobates cultripes]|uniref:Uncharacterized protein n=1 Tax=Pelobates cultripes TaxID=61616 RepID=A0AAD1R1D3_PELCU|nr:Hypothetical predicted protein [Pelobates cultripes]